MSRSRRFKTPTALVAVIVVLLSAAGAWAQGKYKTLHQFANGKDGAGPLAAVIFDQEGNLYGTTNRGGIRDAGVVFELAQNSDGGWTESVLYRFCSARDCSDGAKPAAGVTFDRAGNLYGTTYRGGTADYGTVFRLTPKPDGGWTESVLHSFCSQTHCADGKRPRSGVILDATGNLYGTALSNGKYNCDDVINGCGVVFRLAPGAGGTWTESVLYRFCSLMACSDGAVPSADLIFDGAGNIYGTTALGGFGYGTVFELMPEAKGGWKEATIHRFSGKDGEYPYSSLVLDQAGSLYGATGGGGNQRYCKPYGCGVVFRLTPGAGHRGWKETVIYEFVGRNGADADNSLILDRAGSLYGTTSGGGDFACGNSGCGVVFKLIPDSKGGWDETLLHYFADHPGAYPFSGLIFDAEGNLYGTTNGDQVTTFGSVFEITP